MEDVRLLFLDMDIREGRIWAEKTAETDPYIFTDDDVLPWGKNWVQHGTDVMLRNPEYAVASTRSVIAEEMGNYQPPDTEIYEIPCVGAPMWVRKGIIGPDIRDFLFVEECIEIDNYVKRKGYKTGIISGIRHLHLGFGFATDPRLVRGY